MALISMSASGVVNFVTSTIVEAGAVPVKNSRRTAWICGIVLHVADVDIDAADVLQRAARGLHGGFQVLADLAGLCLDVAAADDLA